ncbi:MAG: hypothetical protein IT207_11420 [Fimbriimonadaceae bacterium]|nr:hypothetical protein [Fimbriimonadaceae bacterium]
MTARLQCSAHGIDDTETVVVELPFDPWNKAVVYGTTKNLYGNADFVTSLVSMEATDEAASRLGTYGHTVTPAGNTLNVGKLAIVASLADVTSYFAVAHGDLGGVNDSAGWQQLPANCLAFGSDIEAPLAPRDGNGVPKFRYAVLYSCKTLLENSPNPYPEFNMQDLDGEPRDSVYCGFQDVVNSLLAPGNTNEWVDLQTATTRLSEHARKLFAHWAGDPDTNGKERIVEESLAFANAEMMPRGMPVADPAFPSGFKKKAVPMVFRGDRRTTLRRVYLTEAEQSATKVADEATFWYYVWSD